MDYDKLMEDLKQLEFVAYNYNINGEVLGMGCAEFESVMADAATAIETLRAENAETEKQLNEFSEFLCHMTGGALSKTNYTAQAMISAAEDYQQRICDNDCGLRADLARVTAERDAAKSPEVLEAVDELIEFARTRMGIAEWLYYVDVLGEWRGQKED